MYLFIHLLFFFCLLEKITRLHKTWIYRLLKEQHGNHIGIRGEVRRLVENQHVVETQKWNAVMKFVYETLFCLLPGKLYFFCKNLISSWKIFLLSLPC